MVSALSLADNYYRGSKVLYKNFAKLIAAGNRQADEDDSDTLTDLFATLFGPRCIVSSTSIPKL